MENLEIHGKIHGKYLEIDEISRWFFLWKFIAIFRGNIVEIGIEIVEHLPIYYYTDLEVPTSKVGCRKIY